MLSPSQQEIVTQLTKGVAVTKSARRGCHHQVNKRLSHSRLKKWGHQVHPSSGDNKSTFWAGTPSQHKKRGHQVKPGSGDTKSTHKDRETPSQPTEKGRGHKVNTRKSCRAYQMIVWKRSIRRETLGSGEANEGHKPPASCPSPPAPHSREATRPNPLSTLLPLEITATTYCSTIFTTHIFSIYSHLCIYVSM